MRSIQVNIIRFIDQEDRVEENFQNLISLFNNHKIFEDKHLTTTVIHLISKLTDNHYHQSDFYNKIEKLLMFFFDNIKKNYTNLEIFNFFKNSKRILLFLMESKILILEETIYYIITNKPKYRQMNYGEFFEPEIKNFVSELAREFDENEEEEEKEKKEEKIENDFIEFIKKRNVAENDNHLCEIIRNDSIEDFKFFIQNNHIELNSIIKPSIFESNIFLIENNKTTIIEYSAFFGSFKIFQYLRENNVIVTSKIWLYAIHSNDFNLIRFIEENIVFQENIPYEIFYKEAVKCHHNAIANYIEHMYLSHKEIEYHNEFDFNDNPILYALHYYNFMLFPDKVKNNFIFYYACKYDYFTIVDIFMRNKDIDLNLKIISTLFYNS